MPGFEEEIVIIAEDDAADFDEEEQESDLSKENSDKKKKKIIISSGIVLSILLFIFLIILLFLKSGDEKNLISMDNIEDKLLENKQKPIEPSKLEDMIAKANYLYSTGSKDKALFLYEKIALHSEAISEYNLGVAQLKNEQYKLALETFQKAINNEDKRCVSAINAAVCSLHLNDQKNFKYYIDLAYAYLASEYQSPLYSYYYTLINYYKGNYLEVLSSLKNTNSNEYPQVQKHLGAKINALFDNNYDAIEAMEKNIEDKDSFTLALLYARVGDITLAQQYLEDSIIKNIEPAKAKLALGLIKLKAGLVREGAKDIQNATDMFPDEIYKYYPITVSLKNTLFDSKKAQIIYRNKIRSSKLLNYQKIFYFSPYKIFNANKTISYIRKGNANIYVDNIESAKSYLMKGSSSSVVNRGITKAIKKALSFHIRKANNQLKELITIQPKHSILHYNLALTFAQMGNMIDAHKHFLRSYHLNAKNYLSGIYAVMSSQLINKENTKLKSILQDDINQEEESESKTLYNTLISISENNIISSIDWLDNNYKQRPLYLALDIIIAINLNKFDYAQKSAKKLTSLLNKDIVPHMMFIDSYFSEYNDHEYATKMYKYLKKQDFHFQDLYHGPFISRYLYTQQSLITGRLYHLRERLKNMIASTKEPMYELLSTLAYASLLNHAYEESYTIYNELIDTLKIRDANTLFLGAIASIAAGHHENAIALLELSKMKDKTLVESRYALGLLYLEVQNNEGATIQLANVTSNSFVSDYFNFNINLNKLLMQKELSHSTFKKNTLLKI